MLSIYTFLQQLAITLTLTQSVANAAEIAKLCFYGYGGPHLLLRGRFDMDKVPFNLEYRGFPYFTNISTNTLKFNASGTNEWEGIDTTTNTPVIACNQRDLSLCQGTNWRDIASGSTANTSTIGIDADVRCTPQPFSTASVPSSWPDRFCSSHRSNAVDGAIVNGRWIYWDDGGAPDSWHYHDSGDNSTIREQKFLYQLSFAGNQRVLALGIDMFEPPLATCQILSSQSPLDCFKGQWVFANSPTAAPQFGISMCLPRIPGMCVFDDGGPFASVFSVSPKSRGEYPLRAKEVFGYTTWSGVIPKAITSNVSGICDSRFVTGTTECLGVLSWDGVLNTWVIQVQALGLNPIFFTPFNVVKCNTTGVDVHDPSLCPGWEVNTIQSGAPVWQVVPTMVIVNLTCQELFRTNNPTQSPTTTVPTKAPSAVPSVSPTHQPSLTPTQAPFIMTQYPQWEVILLITGTTGTIQAFQNNGASTRAKVTNHVRTIYDNYFQGITGQMPGVKFNRAWIEIIGAHVTTDQSQAEIHLQVTLASDIPQRQSIASNMTEYTYSTAYADGLQTLLRQSMNDQTLVVRAIRTTTTGAPFTGENASSFFGNLFLIGGLSGLLVLSLACLIGWCLHVRKRDQTLAEAEGPTLGTQISLHRGNSEEELMFDAVRSDNFQPGMSEQNDEEEPQGFIIGVGSDQEQMMAQIVRSNEGGPGVAPYPDTPLDGDERDGVRAVTGKRQDSLPAPPQRQSTKNLMELVADEKDLEDGEDAPKEGNNRFETIDDSDPPPAHAFAVGRESGSDGRNLLAVYPDIRSASISENEEGGGGYRTVVNRDSIPNELEINQLRALSSSDQVGIQRRRGGDGSQASSLDVGRVERRPKRSVGDVLEAMLDVTPQGDLQMEEKDEKAHEEELSIGSEALSDELFDSDDQLNEPARSNAASTANGGEVEIVRNKQLRSHIVSNIQFDKHKRRSTVDSFGPSIIDQKDESDDDREPEILEAGSDEENSYLDGPQLETRASMDVGYMHASPVRDHAPSMDGPQLLEASEMEHGRELRDGPSISIDGPRGPATMESPHGEGELNGPGQLGELDPPAPSTPSASVHL